MKGVAVELCQRIGPESTNWNTYTTFKDFANAVRQIFCPEAESQMARAEFLARKQGTSENISNYIKHNFALFHSAYEDHNEANYVA